MNILIINNFPAPLGGAEYHVELLRELLEKKGHNTYTFFPKQYNSPKEAEAKLCNILDEKQIELVHIHNLDHSLCYLLDLISERSIKIVQTLHDYRLICISGSFYRNNKLCHKCAYGKYYNAGIYGCCNVIDTIQRYIQESILRQDPLRINKISHFISPSQALIDIMHSNGFKREITHICNFLDLKKYELPKSKTREKYLLFFGRLTPDKGVLTLISAIKNLNIKLKIAGQGQLSESIKNIAKKPESNIELLGFLSNKDLLETINNASIVIVPSEWEETLSFTTMEALALGTPVIASNMGGIPELLQDGNGKLFEPGNIEELRQKITKLFADSEKLKVMSQNGQKFARENLSDEKYYQSLMEIYNR